MIEYLVALRVAMEAAFNLGFTFIFQLVFWATGAAWATVILFLVTIAVLLFFAMIGTFIRLICSVLMRFIGRTKGR